MKKVQTDKAFCVDFAGVLGPQSLEVYWGCKELLLLLLQIPYSVSNSAASHALAAWGVSASG